MSLRQHLARRGSCMHCETETVQLKPIVTRPAPEHEHSCDFCGVETRKLHVRDRDGWHVCKDCEVQS